MNKSIPMLATLAPTMSSRDIAELVDARHDSVKRTIERLATDKDGKGAAIQLPPLVEVINGQGQTVTEYRVGKRDSYIIVAQLSPEFTARLVDRWQELEARVSAPANPLAALNDPIQLRALLLGYDEKVLALQSAVDEQAPKVAALDRFATETKGSYSLREAAKSLQIKPKKFVTWLVERRWIYRHPDGGRWLAFQPRLDSGMLEHKVVTGQRNDGTDWGTTQVRVTAKGIARIAELLERDQGGKAA
ncbi:phage antirepressor KilAC domain-containing protein [Paraburkholderia sediminicola]|uniref:phage antirepressor KilAC domain-containing protein n=1 Tax=Paraburkholderia sediminicola TaxID=458836 RepID=UPI0038B9532C